MTPTPTNPTTAGLVTVYYADVELDNGENLRGLAVGDFLELAEPTAGMSPGTWQAVSWHGEDPAFLDEAVMRPVPPAEVLELRQAASEKLAAVFGGNR